MEARPDTTPVTAIISDVGGHSDALAAAIRELDGNPDTGTLPDGLAIIQVGDLVHRGPDSAGCVELVERFRASGANWTQLAGNHEQQYLGGELFWGEFIDPHSARTLQAWSDDGWLQLAASVDGHLVTHAGLTRGLWEQLGRPRNAHAAAAAIRAPEHLDAVSAAGFMLGGHRTNHDAGVTWAHASREVCRSWEGHQPPFPQVCGHNNPYLWRDRRIDDTTLDVRVDLLDVDVEHRRTRIVIGGQTFWFIDAGLGRHGGRLHPLALPGHPD